mmetsp:Transcript_752/g.2106  ORF Transcript_752/g.2106 Transcript_752/m.2106 type:complete len:304 (-) Transcript_752:96-1007(-)
MASFNSGVLLTKSDALRIRGDERRWGQNLRNLRFDRNKRDDFLFEGAVLSRRQHKPAKEPEKVKVEAVTTDLSQILSKQPGWRLNWLQTALMHAGRGSIQIRDVHEILVNQKFMSDIPPSVGSAMRSLLLANGHLFSQKQVRALQADWGEQSSFATSAPPAKRPRHDSDRSHVDDSGSRASATAPAKRHKHRGKQRTKRKRSHSSSTSKSSKSSSTSSTSSPSKGNIRRRCSSDSSGPRFRRSRSADTGCRKDAATTRRGTQRERYDSTAPKTGDQKERLEGRSETRGFTSNSSRRAVSDTLP